MSTAEPEPDHLVMWWLGVLTAIMVAALGLAFQQISSHFTAEQRHNREQIVNGHRADCAQTKARWNEERAVAIILTKPFPFGGDAVNASLIMRRDQVLVALGPLPKC